MNSKYFFGWLLTLALISCKKDNTSNSANSSGLPTVTTTPITQTPPTTVQSGGVISSDGGLPIIARGICWTNNFEVPTIRDSITTDGSGTGDFSSVLTNLIPDSYYTIRAYATNSKGTGYGYGLGFHVPKQITIPTLQITYLNSMASTLVTVQAKVLDSGNAAITYRGVCWSTAANPTIANNSSSSGAGGIDIQALIMNVSLLTTYHFRAYATNSAGTGYSPDTSLLVTYHIGQGLGGGRIFYIDASGLHGLIAATNDLLAQARWNNTTNPYSNINAYSYANGVANTNAIIAAIPFAGNAAEISRSYNGGGFTDWYLPSINELGLLEQQKSVFGNFQNYFYWSSTASSTYNANAWAVDFGSGYTYDDKDKTYIYFVRPIRAF